MAVPIEPGTALKAGAPIALFSLGLAVGLPRPHPRNTAYDVTPDGQRFLVSVPCRRTGLVADHGRAELGGVPRDG